MKLSGKRALAVVTVVSITALVACSQNSPAVPEQQPSEAAPTAAAAIANVPTALLTKDVGTLSGGGAKVTVLNTPNAPALALGTDVVRNHLLRQRSYGALPKNLQISSGVFASSSKAVGVTLEATAGGKAIGTVTVIYDGSTGRAHTSAAMVQPSRWGELVQQISSQAGEDRATAVSSAMAKPQWPYGDGPALGFTAEGDLVVTFPASTGLGSFRLDEEHTTGLLTTLGQRVRAGSRYPTAFQAGAMGGADTTGDLAGGEPAAEGAIARPTLALGPDCRKLKCVALTFDDGPVPQTAELLATLTKAKAPASFFVLGTSVDANPTLVAQEALAGMVVGSHNQVHNAMTRSDDATLSRQLGRSAGSIRKLTGHVPMFMRPPYGDRSKRVDAVIGTHHMAVALWSIDTNDWKVSGQSPESAQSYVLGNVTNEASAGGVLLMHDIHANSRAAVPAVIDQLRTDGYTLVTLSELGYNDFRWGAKFCVAPGLKSACGA